MSSSSRPSIHHNLAVCATVLNPDASFRNWLDYHLRRADAIWLFMDDPTRRPLFEFYVNDARIVLFDGVVDRSDMTPSGIMNRIMANTQMALDRALAYGIDWLIAVDDDEVFYDAGDHSWQTLDNVGQVTFVNHEAVPAKHEVTNCFAECTTFRVNGRGPFMAYGNGKSAVRVTPGVKAGIHVFSGYQGESRTVEHPAILHYPNPSFADWVAKFDNYDKFSDFWWDRPDSPILLEFMLRSRDLVRAAHVSGDWGEARAYFNSWIPDAESREHLLATGALRHYSPMTEPAGQPTTGD